MSDKMVKIEIEIHVLNYNEELKNLLTNKEVALRSYGGSK